jgi:hypothetical protein
VGAGLPTKTQAQAPYNSEWEPSIKQGISGRLDGLFFCLEKRSLYISLMHNQMNKYDLWIYKSPVKVTPSKRDRKPRIAPTVQGIV